MEHYAAITNCQNIQYHEKMFLECYCLERKSQNTMIPFFKMFNMHIHKNKWKTLMGVISQWWDYRQYIFSISCYCYFSVFSKFPIMKRHAFKVR